MMLYSMQYGRRIGLFICLALLMTQAVLLAKAPTPAHNKVLQVGVLPTLSARVLLKNYQPLRIYLERELKRPVEFSTAPDFKTFHFNTVEGKYDLVVTAAHLARLAQTQSMYLPLVGYNATNRPLLIQAKDRKLRSIQDLKGKTLAFGDRHALVVSQTVKYLQGQGLREEVDYTLLEMQSHSSAAYSVQNHESLLAVTAPSGFKNIPDTIKDSIQVFAMLPEVPSLMWIANPRIASEVSKIKAALIGFTPGIEEGRKFYETTGYIGMSEVTLHEMKALEPYAEDIDRVLKSER